MLQYQNKYSRLEDKYYQLKPFLGNDSIVAQELEGNFAQNLKQPVPFSAKGR